MHSKPLPPNITRTKFDMRYPCISEAGREVSCRLWHSNKLIRFCSDKMRRWFTGETGAEASGVIFKAIISIDFDFTMFIFLRALWMSQLIVISIRKEAHHDGSSFKEG